MKKFLAMLLVTLMLASMCTAFAGDDLLVIAPNPNAGKTVTVRIEGIEGNLYTGEVTVDDGATAMEAMEAAMRGANIDYVKVDSAYGAYISSVGGQDAGTFGVQDGWSYYVNNERANVGMSGYVLEGGEEILFAYGDMSALLPIVTADRALDGTVTITVTADVTYYDENWNATVVREPVADAKVTVDGVAYSSDENGCVKFTTDQDSATVQVEKKAESGLPLVIRLAPGYTVAVPGQKTVSVRVEGIEKTLYEGQVPVYENDTALTAVEAALRGANIDYVKVDSAYGAYISSVGGEDAGTFGVQDGWSYYVNNERANVGMSGYVLQGGEEILFAYGDSAALIPIVDVWKDHNGLVNVTVTADVTYYDENWNATVVREPVADAKVTVDGVEYLTGEDGSVQTAAGEQASVTVQVEKKAESGLPLVIRTAGAAVETAGLEVRMPYSDLPADKWYTPYVLQMTDLEVVNGMDGKFQPAGEVTRAQAVTMLYRLAGQPAVEGVDAFEDTADDVWYSAAVCWAAQQGIVMGDGTGFRPGESVTRQDLAVMLVRYQQNVVKTELPADCEAPAFADNADIAEYAAEAVYLLQKAGIVSGSDGKFLPRDTASRAELCKMLSGLVISD